jgi:hypothetical protein
VTRREAAVPTRRAAPHLPRSDSTTNESPPKNAELANFECQNATDNPD